MTPVPRRAASTAILTGEAGANLVLSRLQEWGVPAQMAMPGLAYDLIADVPGYDLLRIQVKTKSRADGRRCAFALQRGFHYSKTGTFRYHADDYDIAAFVCLRGQFLFFCARALTRISVRTAWPVRRQSRHCPPPPPNCRYLPGAPGSHVSQAAAIFCGLNFIATSYAEWQRHGQGHLGSVLQGMANVFTAARRNQPCLLFIDELDSLALQLHFYFKMGMSGCGLMASCEY